MTISSIRDAVAQGFRGQLLSCTLRRATVTSRDANGDPVATAFRDYPFDGIRETFNAAFAAAAGIPVTDVKILIIAGSLAIEPPAGRSSPGTRSVVSTAPTGRG